jgi:Family of unknown function (DUF6433)
MRKYVTEMLKDINEDPSKIELYKNDAALRIVLMHAFVPQKKFILPEGEPPYKPSPEPMGMNPTNLFNELRRMYVFCREDLKPIKRESLFISLLEGVHPEEAKMLIAVKDQTLHKLYPKINRKLLEKAGLLTPKPKKDEETA